MVKFIAKNGKTKTSKGKLTMPEGKVATYD